MGIVGRIAARWLASPRARTTAVLSYDEGDIIEVRVGGKVRRVLVESREADIKDGEPGWDGLIVSSTDRKDERGASVWGYNSNVIRRIGVAPVGLKRSLEND